MAGIRGVFQTGDLVVKAECHHSRCHCEDVLEISVLKQPLQADGAQLKIGQSQEEQEERAAIYKLHVEAQAALVAAVAATNTANAEAIEAFAAAEGSGMHSDDPPASNHPSGPIGRIVLSGPAHGALNGRMVMSGSSNGTAVTDTYDVLAHFLGT